LELSTLTFKEGGGGCETLQIAFVLKASVQRQYMLVTRTPVCRSFRDFLIEACKGCLTS